MALFDFSNMAGAMGMRPKSSDGGWSSGTTVNPTGAFFSTDTSGRPVGMTSGFQAALARMTTGAAKQMPGGGGAFASAFGDHEPPGQVSEANLGFRRFQPSAYGLEQTPGQSAQAMSDPLSNMWRYITRKPPTPTSGGQ